MKTQHRQTRTLLLATVISIWMLFILSYAAIRFDIYYTFAWFDTFMHFFGGFVAALVVYTLLLKLGVRIGLSLKSFLLIIAGVVVVGLAWEVAEYVVNYLIPTYTFDPVDTSIDLVADTLGAIVATGWIFNHQKKNKYGN